MLERNQPLNDQDRGFYENLIATLRADTKHVNTVTDLWSDPATATAGQSADRRAVTVMLRLSGMIGTSEATDSVAAVRNTLTRLGPPQGLHSYVTGPGATIADEFTAIDRQMLGITAATVGLILLLLLIVYRSLVAAAIPLISVGVAIAVARPIVAALGEAGLVEVSLFSVALLAAMLLGAGTDYAIFLIGRYHEGRRRGVEWSESLVGAYRGVAPVISGSALTIAGALACLSMAHVGIFRSTGIPCAIGVLVAMLASLTLTPALIALAGRRGWLEPRRSLTARRWRRIGVSVARWPAPILVASGAVIVVAALPLIGMRVGWNEPDATPATAESNRGYAAADRHFPANHLLPTVLTVAADHDVRNPAGLIAIERISQRIMAIPGVRMVQSASRPAGRVPDEATLSGQAGVIGRQLNDTFDSVSDRLGRVAELDTALGSMATAVDRLAGGLQGSAAGLREMGSASDDIRAGMTGLQDNVTTVSGYLDPLRGFVSSTPDCPANPICSVVARVVQPVDDVMRSSAQLQQRRSQTHQWIRHGDQFARRSARSRQRHGRSNTAGPRSHLRPDTARAVVGAAAAPVDRLPAGDGHAVPRQRRGRLLSAAASAGRSATADRAGHADIAGRSRDLSARVRQRARMEWRGRRPRTPNRDRCAQKRPKKARSHRPLYMSPVSAPPTSTYRRSSSAT